MTLPQPNSARPKLPPVVPPPIAKPPAIPPPVTGAIELSSPIVKIRTAGPHRKQSRRSQRPTSVVVFYLIRDVSLLAVSVGLMYFTYRTIEQRSAVPLVTQVAPAASTERSRQREPILPSQRSQPRAEPEPRSSRSNPPASDYRRSRETEKNAALQPLNPSDNPASDTEPNTIEPPAEEPIEVAPPPVLPEGVPLWANDSIFKLSDGAASVANAVAEQSQLGVTSAGIKLTFTDKVDLLKKSLTGSRLRIFCQVEDVTIPGPGKPAVAKLSRIEQLGYNCLKSIYVNPMEVDLTMVRKGDYLQVDGVLEKPSRRAQQQVDLQFTVRTDKNELIGDYKLMFFVLEIASVTAGEWKEIQQRRLD